MTAFSNEGRVYRAEKKVIAGEAFIEIAVMAKAGRMVTRDHLPIREARRLAAELVLATESQ